LNVQYFEEVKLYSNILQGDYLSGKPGHVREFTAVMEMSEILLKVREMSGKKSYHGKVA